MPNHFLDAQKQKMSKRMPGLGNGSSMWKIDIARLLMQNKQLVLSQLSLDAALAYIYCLEEITLAYQRSAAWKNNNNDNNSRTATDNGIK
jgi:hypothetical protein